MSPEQKYAHIKDPDQARVERYERILKPGPWNTFKLFFEGLAKGGGPVRPSEMPANAEAELEKIRAERE